MTRKKVDAWEQFPMEEGEVWEVDGGNGRLAVHDIFEPLPIFMMNADFLFIDPPWNRGATRAFYTKAGLDPMQIESFGQFETRLFQCIEQIDPDLVYIEIGFQRVDKWYEWLQSVYPFTQRWDVVYYRKHPCHIIRGSKHGLVDFDYTGMDEEKVIYKSAELEAYSCMGDLCMGLGLVGLAAYQAGKPFVGTELNKRRLANLLQGLVKKGAKVGKVS